MIHGHGSDTYHYEQKIVADFSSNVWYKGPPGELKKHLQASLNTISRYPNPSGSDLGSKLADYFNIPESRILVTNGSVEAFYLLAMAFREKRAAIVLPAFAEYEDAARLHQHKIRFLNNTDTWFSQSFSEELVWFGNPNNPDGKTLNPHLLQQMLRNNPDTLFVVDEAYAELCADFESGLKLIDECKNLVIIRSFTKTFAIPGLRMGFIVAHEEIIQKMNGLRMPWSVNALALEAGKFIMDHYQQLLPDKKQLRKESRNLQSKIEQLKEFSVYPADCNYFLVRLKHGTGRQLKQYLVERHGLLIRDASNFRGLDEHSIRLALQKPQHNRALIDGLKRWESTLDYA